MQRGVSMGFFLVFVRHPKVSALISSTIRNFTKKTPQTLKKYLVGIHISHLVNDMYYQIILK